MEALNRIPLQSLRSAEAVARLGSLSAAAAELGVTPGAVSQQVIRAERQLGLQLFDRQPSGMMPTVRGREITALLSQGFAQLSAAVAKADRGRDDALTVSVAPIFAARWLIWRLPRFSAAHPGIRVRLEAEIGLSNPSAGDVDLGIRIGRGGYRGVAAERLFDQIVFPVCTRELAAQISDHADLARVPVIRDTQAQFSWADWLGPEHRDEVMPGPGPEFSDAAICLDAAISGAGVFLSFETAAADALAMGRLVAPFQGRHPTELVYWLITPQDGRPGAAARHFTRWLKAEIAEAGLGRAVPPGG